MVDLVCTKGCRRASERMSSTTGNPRSLLHLHHIIANLHCLSYLLHNLARQPSTREPPSQSPVLEFLSIPTCDWNNAIQEEEKNTENTLCKKYHLIWDVLKRVMEYWVCCNFEVALKKRGKNSTRFKTHLPRGSCRTVSNYQYPMSPTPFSRVNFPPI